MIWENSDAVENPRLSCIPLHGAISVNLCEILSNCSVESLSVLVLKQTNKSELPLSDSYLILNSQQIHSVL